MPPGRPVSKIEINLNDQDNSISKLKQIADKHDNNTKIIAFIKKLNDVFIDKISQETYTEDIDAEYVLTDMSYLEADDKSYVVHDTFEKLTGNDQVATMFNFYECMDHNHISNTVSGTKSFQFGMNLFQYGMNLFHVDSQIYGKI